MVEIDKGVGCPDMCAKFFPGNDVARALQQ
jgi:hypothetical protein